MNLTNAYIPYYILNLKGYFNHLSFMFLSACIPHTPGSYAPAVSLKRNMQLFSCAPHGNIAALDGYTSVPVLLVTIIHVDEV